MALLYLCMAGWYVVTNAEKLTTDVKLMTVAENLALCRLVKEKIVFQAFSKDRHRYASF